MDFVNSENEVKTASIPAIEISEDSSIGSSSNESSTAKKRQPPAKPPRRRHSASSLKDADTSVNLRKMIHQQNFQRNSSTDSGGKTGHKESLWIDDNKNASFYSTNGVTPDRNFHSLPCFAPNDSWSRYQSSPLESEASGKTDNFSSAFMLSQNLHHSSYKSPPYLYSSLYKTPLSSFSDSAKDVERKSSSSRVSSSSASQKNAKFGPGPITNTPFLKHLQKTSTPAMLNKPTFPRRYHSDPMIHVEEEDGKENAWQSRMCKSFASSLEPKKELSGKSKSTKLRQGCSIAHSDNSEEVKALKEINSKLWQQVQRLQNQLDLLKRVKFPEESRNLKGVSYSELLGDIYYAQKERDEAMKERLLSANVQLELYQKELARLAEVRHDLSDSGSSDDELALSGLDKILHGIDNTQTPAKLLRHQETLLSGVKSVQEHRNRRHKNEIRALSAERDLALERVKALEKNVQDLHMKAIWQSENYWNPSVMETIQQVTSERNAALGKLQELQETLPRDILCEKSPNLNNLSGSKTSSEVQTDFIGLEEDCYSGHPSLRAQHLQEELKEINKKLNFERTRRMEAENKIKWLEDVVNNFQKKCNGLNSF